MAKEWNLTRYHAAANRITGSIERICNVHTSATTTIADHLLGTFVSTTNSAGNTVDIGASPNRIDAGSSEGNIVINAQECVDGPFIAVKIDANPVLIYHNGIHEINSAS